MKKHSDVVAELTLRWPEHKLVPTLGRIEALCDLLGNPQATYPVIQVAGTNGKGSTCLMIEALLRSMGLRVGRFSSPHLQEIGERICIDGEPLAPERFDDLYEQIKPLADIVDAQSIDDVPLTFFEFMTAMAYAAFADAPVDVAVMEVGMGGGWDSTNVAHADVAVVCPVDFDHMHILGNTIEEIAAEKAGIIKEGSTAVLAAQRPEAAKILLERIVEVGAQPLLDGRDFGLLARQPAVGGQMISILATDGPVNEIHLPLFGAHMAHNAALAVAAVEAFQGGRALPAALIEEALGGVVAPARMEIVARQPLVVLDTGHNPHGARATVEAMTENFTLHPLIGIYAGMKDKDLRRVIETYGEILDHMVCTQVASTDRGMPAAELADLAGEVLGHDKVSSAPTMQAAIDQAIMLAETTSDGLGGVLIAGSVIAAGEARDSLVGAGAPALEPPNLEFYADQMEPDEEFD